MYVRYAIKVNAIAIQGEIISGVFRMSNICPEDLYSIEVRTIS